VEIELKDWNTFSSHESLGRVTIPLSQIAAGEVINMECPLEGVASGSLKLCLYFEPQKIQRKESLAQDTEARLYGEVNSVNKFTRGLTTTVTSGLSNTVSNTGSFVTGFGGKLLPFMNKEKTQPNVLSAKTAAGGGKSSGNVNEISRQGSSENMDTNRHSRFTSFSRKQDSKISYASLITLLGIIPPVKVENDGKMRSSNLSNE
jgi:hypothetical protein